MKKFVLSSFLTILTVFLLGQAQVQAATLTINAPLEGVAPAPEKIKTDADPKCKMMHPAGLVSDEVIVNSNNTLKDVLVYVKDGLGDKKFDAPKTPVVFNQQGCQYSPKVFGIMVNQPLQIVNSDDTLHNVHALPTQSAQFNLGMPIKGMKLTKTFTKAEVPVKIKCEVHSWMKAYAGVFDNPYYAVTDDKGAAQIKDLPPGEYTIEAWHEKYGTQSQKVTVTDKDQTVDLKFKA